MFPGGNQAWVCESLRRHHQNLSFGIDFRTNGRIPNPPERLGDPEEHQSCNADLIFRNNEGVMLAQTRVLLAAGAADFRYLQCVLAGIRVGDRAATVPSLYLPPFGAVGAWFHCRCSIN